jgi:hypothetical protein
VQIVKNAFEWPFDIMKHRFIDIQKDVQKADYEFAGPFAYLNRHLSDFTKVAFSDSQSAENEIAGPFDTLKHSFTNVAV